MSDIKEPVIGAEPRVTAELALQHGLTPEEYDRVIQILGRTPTYTELGIYSVMWSEHCSYKNSIAVIKTLPRSGGRMLVAAGEENAGLVDIGDGLAVAFKIESHNHPSAVEPYQGAATGVGGILRDIFSMGARPIAVLNSLRFGNLSDGRVRSLFKNVVKGIADYGNSFGVPTVAGEVYFDECYRKNPLVNAMAVGIVEHDRIALAIAEDEGSSVMIVGSLTGRDGIHGATFASEEISERSESKRPAVQVGDPFVEKLLLEATLEAIRTGHVIGIQDMGAAGLTCSTTEMSAKGRHGMNIDLRSVPLRESDMSAYEIMLSESQERMLFVVKKGREEEVDKIFKKWDLHANVIGKVDGSGRVRVHIGATSTADVPAETLVLGGGAPVYSRESVEPAYIRKLRESDGSSMVVPSHLGDELLRLLAEPSIASKRWVYEQYDSMVRTNTVVSTMGDAALIRLKGTRKGIAAKTDCNARYVYMNPRRGGQIAVAEAARNVACIGARPVAITNCLNFGNPYDPEVYWQFKEAVAGIGDACRALETPVTGGNVSFYNESPDGAIYPTPVIGMLGLAEDVELCINSSFRRPGDLVMLLGRNGGEIGGSTYQLLRSGSTSGDAPALNLTAERALQACLVDLIEHGLIRSAHDVSDGGLAVCVAESMLGSKSGLGVRMDPRFNMRPDFYLFGESQSLVVISCEPRLRASVLQACGARNVEVSELGGVTESDRLMIHGLMDLKRSEIGREYDGILPRIMGGFSGG